MARLTPYTKGYLQNILLETGVEYKYKPNIMMRVRERNSAE